MPDPAAPAASLTGRLDKELAAKAYKKVMAGEEPTAQERAALRRYEHDQEETRRWQYYEAIPQKHWRAMSGRQTKVLNEQAERYGIPCGGRTINLPSVVRAFHDFLAANARKLNVEDDDLMAVDVATPALERYREERAALARLDRLERERVLVSRDEVREGLGRIAMIVRGAGEALQQQYGRGAVELLDEALDDAEREIARLFGTMNGESSTNGADLSGAALVEAPDAEAAS